MKITEVTFIEKRNLGNYENVDLSMTATVGEDEDSDFVADKLEKKVRRKLDEIQEERS